MVLPHSPAKPQEEDAEQSQRGVVAGHVDRVAVSIEAANAGTKNPDGRQGGKTADLQRGVIRRVVM
jgi:hypothetical protein